MENKIVFALLGKTLDIFALLGKTLDLQHSGLVRIANFSVMIGNF